MLQSSGLEDLRKKLLEDAERRASEIIEGAKREAESIVEEAERAWKEGAERERERIVKGAEAEANRILSEARVRSKLLTSEAKSRAFGELFSEVERLLREREGIDVKSSLDKLLSDSLAYIDKPAKIVVDPRDVDAVKEILRKRKIRGVEVVGSSDVIGGVIVESEDGRRVDNSYKTRLERAKRVLGPAISRQLWRNRS